MPPSLYLFYTSDLTNPNSKSVYETSRLKTSTNHPDSLHGWLWFLEGGHDEVADGHTQGPLLWTNPSKQIVRSNMPDNVCPRHNYVDFQALRRLLDMCLSYSRDGRSSFRNVKMHSFYQTIVPLVI